MLTGKACCFFNFVNTNDIDMKEFLQELYERNGLLFWFGAANIFLSLLFFILSRTSTIQVLGINAWIKPLKFALSIAIYSWTMAWFIAYLPQFNKNLFAWSVILLLGFEIIYIGIQAGRGQLSHFNQSSGIYKTLYVLMAFAATATSIYTAYIGVLFFINRFAQLPDYYVWSIRLGILLFVLFSFEGFIMGARLSHTVGGKDGGKGLPFVNWSITKGDLRIAHFVGMHALQVLPFLSYYLFRNTMMTLLIAFFYAGVATMILLIALQGKPIFKTNEHETKTMVA